MTCTGIRGTRLFIFTNLDLSEILLRKIHSDGSIPKTPRKVSDTDAVYSYDFVSNDITRLFPMELIIFENLYIDVTDNIISTTDCTLCQKQN